MQFGVAHVTLTLRPPPTGVAFTVYGPVVPGAGVMERAAEVELSLTISSDGDLRGNSQIPAC